MNPQTTGLDAIRERISKLERQNRRMKQAGILALLGVAAVLLMGQAPGHQTVEANEFVLKDSKGRVMGEFAVNNFLGEPGLHLYHSNGKPAAWLSVWNDGTASLSLYHSNGQFGARLQAFKDGAHLAMADSKGKMEARLRMFQDQDLNVDGAGLDLSDREGFETTIGNTELVTPRTGETHKTSAASVVLFDKDKHVIWMAP